MSILFLSSFEKLHETALSMKIGTKSTLNRHQVGTKPGLSRDQVVVQPPTQLPTQLYKTTFYKQVTEQVAFSNHREHTGHREFAAEVRLRLESQFTVQGGVK